MSRPEQDLSHLFDRAFPEAAPGPELWDATQTSMRRRVRTRRVTLAALAGVVVLGLAVAPQVLSNARTSSVDFYEPAPVEEPREVAPAPEHAEKPLYPEPAPPASPVEEPAAPPPASEADGAEGSEAEEAPPATPARVEIRDYRVVLLDSAGAVLRTLYGDYDPAVDGLEYGMGSLALRPGSTTRDLAVTVVDGDSGGAALHLIVVRDAGEAQVTRLATIDYEETDHASAAGPAAAWSPDGAFLAWLQPDAANRAVLRGLRWSGGAPAGDATPPGGVLIDPAGVAQADGVQGLEVQGWQADPDQLVVRGYRFSDGQQRSYALPVTRSGGHLHPGQLSRAE